MTRIYKKKSKITRIPYIADMKDENNNVFMLPKTTNNFTLTPDYGISSSQLNEKFNLKDSGFDAKTLGELGTLFPG